jgi:hypothetical protein
MKVLGAISTTAMFLLLAATVPTFAQEEHPQEGAKPAQHEEQAKPQKQEEAKPERQEAAKPQKQEQQAKPVKQEQAKPEKQQEQAKPQKQEQQAKSQQQSNQQKHTQQQVKAQQNDQKNQQHQQPAKAQAQDSQRQYARNGQKDQYGHEYNESHFGRDHHTRFQENGGRYYNGRREYSYGGYWFYAGSYPSWFYQQDVFFVMGADGLWYAVSYNDPSLTFQVNIG